MNRDKLLASAHRLEQSQVIARPVEEVFAFFSDAQNLEAITPAFLHFQILTPLPIAMARGTQIDYALSLFGIPTRWRTRITDWQPGVMFVDEQERGPYALWRHTHTFTAHSTGTLMHDLVEYREPLGVLGSVAHVVFVKSMVERIFAYRRAAVEKQLG